MCATLCPANKTPDALQNECVRVLGVKSKSDAILSNSASGGAFAGIAARILAAGDGVVFGCAFDGNIVAGHASATDFTELAPLQSSKYVQSDVGDTYLRAKALLDEGKTVFYTGTPCQIAGLNAFLNKKYDNLLTADLICHGVPSPLLFKRYLNRLGKKYRGEVMGYNFRSKIKIRAEPVAEVIIKTGTGIKRKIIHPNIDPYYKSFNDCYTFRECCYGCQYANNRRIADLTFGDFWGIEKTHPEFYSPKGVSVILINTEKGEGYFNSYSDDFYILETTLLNVAARNWNLTKPSVRPALRDTIYSGINDDSTDIFAKPEFKVSIKTLAKTYVRYGVKRILPTAVINAIKAV